MKFVFALAWALVPGAASAENLSGNELLSVCEAKDDSAQLGYCLGYVQGAIEGMKWGISVPLFASGEEADQVDKAGNAILGFCLPTDVTLGQNRDVIVKFLTDNPAERHNSARTLIQDALKQAFPCG